MTEKDAICQISLVNEKKVSEVRNALPDDEIFSALSDTFKAFGDMTRVRILYALSKSELCVCDLSVVLEMSVSAISHQLRVLRNMNLVRYRKDGKMAYYSLCDDHVLDLITLALIHVNE
jgi:ArsR family transcriptional regulator, lead/cadmium/zinc/bismuth-responsive transcriptional repressor